MGEAGYNGKAAMRKCIKVIFNLFAVFIIFIGVLFALTSISMVVDRHKEAKIPWRLDFNYSFAFNFNKGFKKADALRIYKTLGKRRELKPIYICHELFKQEMVFETTDKRFIERFVQATQDEAAEYVEECKTAVDEKGDGEGFHVVAFDRTFMRIGYFYLERCRTADGKEYGEIVTIFNSGVYLNKPLLNLFKEELRLIKAD